MDFTLDENQQAVSELANQIFFDRTDPTALKVNEDSGKWFEDSAKSTYLEVAKAGLVGIAVSEEFGGGGLGLVELGQVLEAQGRHLSPVPVLSTALSAVVIDKFGSKELKEAELPALLDGSAIASIGIQEWHSDDYLNPESTVSKNAATGTKIVVEFADVADKMLIVAKGKKAGLYLVDLKSSGISMNEGTSTRFQKVYEVIMSGADAVEITNDKNAEAAVEWFINAATALYCATQVGVSDEALKMSAEYTTSREQFGRPIATFQAVTHRLADQYINVNGIKLLTQAALWTLDHISDDSDLTMELATERVCQAKWFSSHLAMDVANASQHVHGGIGMDRDYPLHRYTLWNKHIQTTLGAGTQQLRRLGAQLAAV